MCDGEIATQQLPCDLWNNSKTRSWLNTERPSPSLFITVGYIRSTLTRNLKISINLNRVFRIYLVSCG